MSTFIASLPVSLSSPASAEPRRAATPRILGQSAAMQQLRTQVRRLGPHFRTVLLHGEAGTGKELVARALHSFSSHAEGPFVVFDAGEGSTTGTGSGAQSTAPHDIRRMMQVAHRGTLYLRRIEELSVGAQTELLAVLQSRDRVRRGPIMVHGLEARIIASTTENLRVLAAANRFVEGLCARLTAVEIELCPLRERTEDLQVLAEHFIARYAASFNRPSLEIPEEAVTRMLAYRWPGNVQELKDRMQRAVELGADGILQGKAPGMPKVLSEAEHASSAVSTTRLQEVVEQHVFQVLKKCAGNKVRAAEMLGISRSTLYRMLDAGLQGDRMSGLS